MQIILLAAVGQMVSCGVRVNAPDPPAAPELEPKVADNRLRGNPYLGNTVYNKIIL